MKQNGGSAFFEVFRRMPHTAGATATKKRGTPDPARGSTLTASSRHRSGSESVRRRGYLTLTVSHEAVVIIAFVLIGIIVASHVWGYRRGKARDPVARSRPTSVRTVTDGERVAQPAAPGDAVRPAEPPRTLTIRTTTAMEPPFWTVRIIGGIARVRAREVRDHLRENGYDAFVIQPKREHGYAVGVGCFPRRTDAAAIAMKSRFVNMKFRGETWFTQAYLTEITNKRSIVQ